LSPRLRGNNRWRRHSQKSAARRGCGEEASDTAVGTGPKSQVPSGWQPRSPQDRLAGPERRGAQDWGRPPTSRKGGRKSAAFPADPRVAAAASGLRAAVARRAPAATAAQSQAVPSVARRGAVQAVTGAYALADCHKLPQPVAVPAAHTPRQRMRQPGGHETISPSPRALRTANPQDAWRGLPIDRAGPRSQSPAAPTPLLEPPRRSARPRTCCTLRTASPNHLGVPRRRASAGGRRGAAPPRHRMQPGPSRRRSTCRKMVTLPEREQRPNHNDRYPDKRCLLYSRGDGAPPPQQSLSSRPAVRPPPTAGPEGAAAGTRGAHTPLGSCW
jgi:hypothetical protein